MRGAVPGSFLAATYRRMVRGDICRDCRGAEGVNKILILALVAIPLVIVLVFFGGEVRDYLLNAWEDRQGKEITEGGSPFDRDLPGEEPGVGDGDLPDDGDGEEPEEECGDPLLSESERKRCLTINILIQDIYLYVEWSHSGGQGGTGMTLGEYREAHWTGELIHGQYGGGPWVWPADAWGGRCVLGIRPLDDDGLDQLSSVRALSEGAQPRLETEVHHGPDGIFATEDDLVWRDRFEPRPEGWP